MPPGRPPGSAGTGRRAAAARGPVGPGRHAGAGQLRYRDDSCLARLAELVSWAAERICHLVRLESDGLAAAHGDSLVHFDLYPHNILLTPDRVVFVDWPHARLGAPVVDLVMVLSSAAADRIDVEPMLTAAGADRTVEPALVDAILAAHAGFLINGALSPTPAGLEPIAAAKLHLGLGAVGWLRQRLTGRRQRG